MRRGFVVEESGLCRIRSLCTRTSAGMTMAVIQMSLGLLGISWQRSLAHTRCTVQHADPSISRSFPRPLPPRKWVEWLWSVDPELGG